ncbi:MAG: efflux RND transporter periplasmic adaptor subunit [Bacteroidales bacterium]|nr:efflux RND transporter periplasmic adaptor subunit [Bacteroidales bacterium]
MKPLLYLSLLVMASLFVACNSHKVGNEAHDDHAADALSYTLFSDDYELFVEFPALNVGQTSQFAAHFTHLGTYKPVAEGQLTVSIVKDGKGLRHSVEGPSSPGIFRPALQPKEAGSYQLLFELTSQAGKVTFEIPDIKVHANAEEAAQATEVAHADDAISFLKEQAWKTDFGTKEVRLQPFHTVIHTSARVKGQPQSMVAVNAQTEGQVNLLIVVGQSVKKGELLAVIASSGLENNLNTRVKESKMAFEKSKADFNRTQPLAKNQVLSQKDFLTIEAQYKQDSLRYLQLANQVSQNGLSVTSPIEGYVSSVHVSNGQFVNNGSVVMQIGNKSHLLIEAFVNQSDFQKVGGIFDANFSFTNNRETITLEALNGQVTSNNAFVNENATRIPVTFSSGISQ